MLPPSVRVLTSIGRVLVTVGLLMVAFAGFQLWGTGLAEARAQDTLSQELEASLEASRTSSTSTSTRPESAAGDPNSTTAPLTTSTTSSTAQPTSPGTPIIDRTERPDPGRAAGRILIPAIELDKVFVEGVERDHLRLGPGRYPDSAWPGRNGNAAIAGHRTTHGAPFSELDRLKPGDEIIVETFDGRFRYLVQGHGNGSGATVGHFIVDPSAVDVLDDKGDNRLTLTACHPRYSAAQRIIVTAILVDDPLPSEPLDPPNDKPDRSGAPTNGARGDGGDESAAPDVAVMTPEAADSIDASLGWQPEYLWPMVAGGALTAAVAAIAWWVARGRNRWGVYAIAAAPFLASLFWWFTNLDKLLPAV